MSEPSYQIRIVRSRRKTIGLVVESPECVTVRAPLHTPVSEISRVLKEHESWILSHLEKAAVREQKARQLPPLTLEELRQLADEACALFPGRIQYWARIVGVRYGRVTIRNQKTRWGSCSSAGNLNFNCLLMLCPREIIDYVIVHELCHRKEMNHSPRFWAEVARVLPDYAVSRKWLKENGPVLLNRMP